MYKKILVALDATAADQTILEHVTKLALPSTVRWYSCTWPMAGLRVCSVLKQ